MAKDSELSAHQEWLGYVQPVGLVVSPPALLAAQAHVNRNILPEHCRFLEWVEEVPLDGEPDPAPAVTDLPGFFGDVLGWEPGDLLGTPGGDPLPETLEAPLPEYNETLRPTYAIREFEPKDGGSPYLMLIQVLRTGADLDAMSEREDHRWQASPQARFERLLRETQVPIGLLANGTHLRLVYAPKGENSGHATFPVRAMSEVGGRPIFAALHMLLSAERLFALSEDRRLPALLALSRKYQNQVTTRLADQVLAALYELLRGVQAADEHRRGELLREVLREDPDHVYAGLLTVLLRLVFTLYAEERGLLSNDPVYVNHYVITGLFERLRADAGRYPDTMDQRYGAWAQLLSLFRLIHDGGGHAGFRLPPRHGHLFNPDRYNFLEGRPWTVGRVMGERIVPPMISDGVVFRVLENLMVLDGERLSYRTLEVEQIGSVYETMMGFHLEVARGRSIAIKPAKPYGAPATINLDELLQVAPDKRAKWVREQTDQAVEGTSLEPLKAAQTPEEMVAALSRKVAREATPHIVPAGAMVLQPSNERRRSGSHYTPRSLTEPIVRTALRPILQRLGDRPTPDQVLALKVCDPAMGSGAFLVEATRQIGDALVKAWHDHACLPPIPLDEDEHLHARRLVAQRCLYGVDKNPMAVDLAKLSLWLETLARDHAFTFLDHALRHGDSLVGLTRDQIGSFHWTPAPQADILHSLIKARVKQAMALRVKIQTAGEGLNENELRMLLLDADETLADVRLVGDLVIAAFFQSDKPRERETARQDLQGKVEGWLSRGQSKDGLRGIAEGLREMDRPIAPFHWEIEFPEVFGREKPGFDAMVGNPPFAGKNTTINSNAPGFLDWLKQVHEESHGNADLVAHFYRRAFNLLREDGCFGLIATNTIGQGDTRSTGLRYICTHGGTIYCARRRLKWPGRAAVVVSVVHVKKGEMTGPFELDRKTVPTITAYLFHAGGHENPAVLAANANKSFQGSIVLGMGFTFDDTDKKGVASPIAEMHRLIQKDPRNAERIFPYIGGEEVNDDPEHKHKRYVINFADFPLRRADIGISWTKASDKRRTELLRSGIVPLDYPEPVAANWPELLSIIEQKVKPERLKQKDKFGQEKWWLFLRTRPELQRAMAGLSKVIVRSRIGNAFAFTFLPSRVVMNEKTVVFPSSRHAFLSVMQSRVHEIWAVFFSSTLKDDLQYTPSDCFETFPFPDCFETPSALETAGGAYYEFRAGLMVRNNEGLTKTYNRFHDLEERSSDILKLRELHATIDRAVLDAYGWMDLQPTCEFLLDYEEDEEEDSNGGRSRKKPWRYRWPDDLRDEVLARLLALNRQRAEEEQLSGKVAEEKAAYTVRRGSRKSKAPKGFVGKLV